MAKRLRRLDRRPAPGRAAARPSTASAGPGASPSAAPARETPRFAPPALIAVGVFVVAAMAVMLGGPPGSGAPAQPATAGATQVMPVASATGSGASAGALTPSPDGIGAPVISGIVCDVDEQVAYHAHAHLNVRLDGELQPVPTDIGVRPTCLYWLHTHAPHGVVHVEAPAEAAFTLGQFFDVWGESLSGTQVLGRTVDASESTYVFVDRKPYVGDPRGIILGDLVAIEIQVGPKPLEPLPYTFQAEFQ